MNKPKEKETRIDIRLERELKNTIEVAARLQGQTLSAFVLSHIVEDARRVIDKHRITNLSLVDWNRFVEILEKPLQPNKSLLKAVKKYKDAIVHSDGF